MKRISVYSLDYYNKCIVSRIINKYNMTAMDAVRAFMLSKTHAMLEDPEMALWEFSEWAVFDMWEAEKNSGDPRNSIYLRGEA